ncbi:MAG: amidohydrolase family protein [Gammaproteobacteria bacterium]|nr:amidohydrolase family protein [Gammaproteobacteria bacterium]
MTDPVPGTQGWLDQVSEPIIDPDRTIVDPHHHLWERAGWTYLLEDLRKDTASGHRVEKTVFVECGANYLETGPEHLRCVGETEFVTEIAAASKAVRAEHRNGKGAQIAGIVARADLTLGDAVEEVLDAHRHVAGDLFKGIRHAGARARDVDQLTIAGRAPEGLYARADFRRGLKRLGDLGYSYDTWHYHYQNPDYAALARAVPDTVMILDHFGTPLGVGPYSDQREEIFAQWQKDITEIAACPNVVAKLGGLAMPDNGFGWHTADKPPDSKTFATAQRRYYLHTIEAFGPDRCMFESNFPVDRMSISYQVLWNGLKRIAAQFSDAEQNAMFAGTAARVYRLS